MKAEQQEEVSSSTTENETNLSLEEVGSPIITASFGAENRNRLITEYFIEAGETFTPEEAWKHIYKLLLWIDRTTGLAHCYESDKSQPGKRWYARSLAFHDWLSDSLGYSPASLGEHIDWLFRRAVDDLAREVEHRAHIIVEAAASQRAPYEGRDFPVPGEDPELENIVREGLERFLSGEPDAMTWQLLIRQVRQYLALENKRKNLVGEGFEDVLAQIVKRALPGKPVSTQTRQVLQGVPGFSGPNKSGKQNKVDLAIVRPGKRTLVTAKWSVRADREKQFKTDYDDYISAKSDSQPFEYVFVTNEFDPARLFASANLGEGKGHLFDHVVHINTDALKTVYKGARKGSSMLKVLEMIDQNRILSMAQWLQNLSH